MNTLKSIKDKKKDLKESQKLVQVKALKGAKHLIEGKVYSVGVELSETLLKAKKVEKA